MQHCSAAVQCCSAVRLAQFWLNSSLDANGPDFGANSDPFLEKVRILTKWSEFGSAKDTGLQVCVALHYTALHCTTLHCTLNYSTLHCAAVHALRCMHCTTLLCTALTSPMPSSRPLPSADGEAEGPLVCRSVWPGVPAPAQSHRPPPPADRPPAPPRSQGR